MTAINAVATTATIPEAPLTLSILCVDDEANILSALRRVFRGNYRVFSAESGKQGLELLEREPIDLVISDMRMPNMNGAEFLEQVHLRWPSTFRVLLTGFSELNNAIEAINRGRIHRYLGKPWQEDDLLGIADEVRGQIALRTENTRLQALTLRQNEELKQLNSALESRVKARTQEISQTVSFLELAQEKLKKTLITSLHVLSNVIDMREQRLAGHSKRVTDLSRQLAAKMGMGTNEIQDITFAALLHDIGLIGVSDAILSKPFSALNIEERAEFMRHPARGVAILAELETLRGALPLIRHHHECFDGSGYPDGIRGMAIPLGARVLAVVNDYDDFLRGQLTATPMREPEIRTYLRESAGKRYDPLVVNEFLEILKLIPNASRPSGETLIRAKNLHRGMVLMRDVVTSEGVLLLSKGFTLTDAEIQQIIGYEKIEPKPLAIWVKEL